MRFGVFGGVAWFRYDRFRSRDGASLLALGLVFSSLLPGCGSGGDGHSGPPGSNGAGEAGEAGEAGAPSSAGSGQSVAGNAGDGGASGSGSGDAGRGAEAGSDGEAGAGGEVTSGAGRDGGGGDSGEGAAGGSDSAGAGVGSSVAGAGSGGEAGSEAGAGSGAAGGSEAGAGAGGAAGTGGDDAGGGAGGDPGPTCVDACSTQGAERCEGQAAVVTCEVGLEGCLEWSAPVACPASLTCSNGDCAATCEDECTVVDARACEGNAYKTCGNYDSDGCLEWNEPRACTGTSTCSNGYCAVGCTDECDAIGAPQCSLGGLSTCGLFDADPCLDLSTPLPCEESEVCSDGACRSTCQNECASAGLTQCAGNAVRTCGNTNGDSCFEWGTPSPCGLTKTCSDGACVALDPPEAVISEVLYSAPGIDTETFIELHGSAGTSLAGLSLEAIDGNGGATYASLALSGAFGEDGLFVIVHPSASFALRALADMESSFVDLQDGPDSLQLRWGESVIDALGYGNFQNAAFAGEGSPAEAAPPGHSLARDGDYTDTDDNATDFTFTASPSPGADNPPPNQAPVAALSCPSQAYVGQPVTFDASGSLDADGAIAEYTVTFGDGDSGVSSVPSLSHSYAAVDVYTVQLTVTDAAGAIDTASCQLNVIEDPCASVTCNTPPADTCTTGTTARRYSGEGTCVAGLCQYPSVTETCAEVCQAGACAAATCGGSTCNTPPADFCTNANQLTRHAKLGRCSSDTCTYQATQVRCSLGCFQGACIEGSWETDFPLPALSSTLQRISLAVDALGRPHMAYCSNAGLIYRTRSDYGWETKTVDAIGNNCTVALTLDEQGLPVIAYHETSNSDLRYARVQNGSFSLGLVDTEGAAGYAPALALSPSGNPAVVYQKDNVLWFAEHDGVSFQKQSLGGSYPSVGNWHSLMAFAPNGDLYVLTGLLRGEQYYTTAYHYRGRAVRLLRRSGGSWSELTVNPSGLIGTDSLLVLTDGSVRVLHSDVQDAAIGGPANPRWAEIRGMQIVHDFGVANNAGALGMMLGIFDVENTPHSFMSSGSAGTVSARDDDGTWVLRESIPSGNHPDAALDMFFRPGKRLSIAHARAQYTVKPACVPTCTGRACGSDLCGGSCGQCGGSDSCSEVHTCTPWQYEILDPWTDAAGVYVRDDGLHGIGAYGGKLSHAHGPGSTTAIESVDPDALPSSWSARSAEDGNGALHVAVFRDDIIDLYSESANGWDVVTPGYVTGPFDIVFAVGDDGSAHFAWITRSSSSAYVPYVLTYAKWDGVSFTTKQLAAVTPADNMYASALSPHSIDVDSGGGAHLTYISPLTSPIELVYATNASGSWVTRHISGFAQSKLMIDDTDRIHLVYSLTGGTHYGVKQSNGTFSDELATPLTTRLIALDASNRPVLYQQPSGGSNEMRFFVRESEGVWTPTSLFVAVASGTPRLVVTDDEWHVFWGAVRHAYRPTP